MHNCGATLHGRRSSEGSPFELTEAKLQIAKNTISPFAENGLQNAAFVLSDQYIHFGFSARFNLIVEFDEGKEHEQTSLTDSLVKKMAPSTVAVFTLHEAMLVISDRMGSVKALEFSSMFADPSQRPGILQEVSLTAQFRPIETGSLR
jgi:hypothetical protein